MNQQFDLINIRTSFNNKAAISQLIKEMKSAKPQSAVKIEAERRPLAEDFIPGPYDVICARGKQAAQHAGNVRFREIIQRFKPSYANAANKVEKSLIVSEIVDSVRGYSPEGGFVKKFGGRYYEVGDSVAREKIGQCLRDQLHSQYKSSTKAKKNRRKELRAIKKESEVPRDVQAKPANKRDSYGSFPFSFPLLPLEAQSSMALLQELPLESQSSLALFQEFAATAI
jgi:hypothetical protein